MNRKEEQVKLYKAHAESLKNLSKAILLQTFFSVLVGCVMGYSDAPFFWKVLMYLVITAQIVYAAVNYAYLCGKNLPVGIWKNFIPEILISVLFALLLGSIHEAGVPNTLYELEILMTETGSVSTDTFLPYLLAGISVAGLYSFPRYVLQATLIFAVTVHVVWTKAYYLVATELGRVVSSFEILFVRVSTIFFLTILDFVIITIGAILVALVVGWKQK